MGGKCGQHCFWLNYRLLVFSDFSITQLRKSVCKPGDREVLLLEIHRKLLSPVHSHPRTTTKGQLGFWPKVTMWTEICPIVPLLAWHSREMQDENHTAPPLMSWAAAGEWWFLELLRQRQAMHVYSCRLQVGTADDQAFCQQSACPPTPSCMTLALFSCISLLTQ